MMLQRMIRKDFLALKKYIAPNLPDPFIDLFIKRVVQNQ